MNEEIHCITNKGKTIKNEWENDDWRWQLCTVYTQNLGNFFSILYLLTCLNKDA